MMVGRDVDDANPSLREWIIAGNVKEKVLLLGERHDVNVCLAAMDIFCMPSLKEALPNVVGRQWRFAAWTLMLVVLLTSNFLSSTWLEIPGLSAVS